MFTERLTEYAQYLDSIKMDMSAQRKIGFYCLKNYDLPLKELMRLTTREFFKATEDEIFMLANGTDFACGTHWVTDLFSEAEIQDKQNIHYEASTDFLPIKIECFQLNEKEWVGRIDYDTVVTLIKHDCFTNNIFKMTELLRKKSSDDYYYHHLRELVRYTVTQIGNGTYKPSVIIANIFPETAEFEYNESEKIFSITKLRKELFVISGMELIFAIAEMTEGLKDKIKDMSFPIRLTNFNDQEEKEFLKQKIECDKVILRKKNTNV